MYSKLKLFCLWMTRLQLLPRHLCKVLLNHKKGPKPKELPWRFVDSFLRHVFSLYLALPCCERIAFIGFAGIFVFSVSYLSSNLLCQAFFYCVLHFSLQILLGTLNIDDDDDDDHADRKWNFPARTFWACVRLSKRRPAFVDDWIWASFRSGENVSKQLNFFMLIIICFHLLL